MTTLALCRELRYLSPSDLRWYGLSQSLATVAPREIRSQARTIKALERQIEEMTRGVVVLREAA